MIGVCELATNRAIRSMAGKYEWVIGQRASFTPAGAEGEDTITGEIVDVRNDSPWPEEDHYRIVIDAGDKVYDVAKERVSLE